MCEHTVYTVVFVCARLLTQDPNLEFSGITIIEYKPSCY